MKVKIWSNSKDRTGFSEEVELIELYSVPTKITKYTHHNDIARKNLFEKYNIRVGKVRWGDGKEQDNMWINQLDINMDQKQEVLQNCTVEGNTVKLPEGQLDRKLYQEVAKSLTLIGGKWKGGKVMGFVFQEDPTDLLKEIASGEKRNLKKEFQFFGTPAKLADRLVKLAEIEIHHVIGEPQSGQGAIVEAILRVLPSKRVYMCELMPLNVKILHKKGYKQVHEGDYLKMEGLRFDRIISNPPFTKNQDIDHVLKMYSDLLPNGRLVSVMSESWVNGNQKKQVEFRKWLSETDAEIQDIERGAFKESGTMVGGKIVIINK